MVVVRPGAGCDECAARPSSLVPSSSPLLSSHSSSSSTITRLTAGHNQLPSCASGKRSSVAAAAGAASNDASMGPRAALIGQPKSHPFQERYLNLQRPEKIGRAVSRGHASTNDALFDCKVLSRNHALLWFEDGKFYLKDTKSSNGTYVNKERLVSSSSEESAPCEVSSGDIVQFGVDVVDNSNQAMHNCIIAMLKLFLPDGSEAKTRNSCVSGNAVNQSQLCLLRSCLQEAGQRVRLLEQKLGVMCRLLTTCRTAVTTSWKAQRNEEQLRARLELLEAQNALFCRIFSEEKYRDHLLSLQRQNDLYQQAAKCSLAKLMHDKLEAVQTVNYLKCRVTSLNSEFGLQKRLRKQAELELSELLGRHEQLQLQLTTAEQKLAGERQAALDDAQLMRQQAAEQASRIEQLTVDNKLLDSRLQQSCSETATRLECAKQESNNVDHLSPCKPGVQHTHNSNSNKSNGNSDDRVGDGDCFMPRTHVQLLSLQEQLNEAECQLNQRQLRLKQLHEELSLAERDVSLYHQQCSELEAKLVDINLEVVDRKQLVRQLIDKLAESDQLPNNSVQQHEQLTGDNNDACETTLLAITTDSDDEHTEVSEVETEQARRNSNAIKELLVEAQSQHAAADGRMERCSQQLHEARNSCQRANSCVLSLNTRITEAGVLVQESVVRVAHTRHLIECVIACRDEASQHLHSLKQQQQQLTHNTTTTTTADGHIKDAAEDLCGQRVSVERRLDSQLNSADQLNQPSPQSSTNDISMSIPSHQHQPHTAPTSTSSTARSDCLVDGEMSVMSTAVTSDSTIDSHVTQEQQARQSVCDDHVTHLAAGDEREHDSIERILSSYNVLSLVVITLSVFVGFLVFSEW